MSGPMPTKGSSPSPKLYRPGARREALHERVVRAFMQEEAVGRDANLTRVREFRRHGDVRGADVLRGREVGAAMLAACNRKKLAEAAALLKTAKKAVLISGGGVRYSLAENAVAEFAVKRGIPIVETIAGKGDVTHYHPAHAGPIGVIGSTSANALAAEADVFLAVGTRLQDFATGSWTAFSHDVKFISIDAARFDALKHRAFAVVGDAQVRVRAQMDFFIAADAHCIAYGETARSVQGVHSAPLATKPKLSEDQIKAYGARMTAFAKGRAGEGMPISYHHHMAAAIETEPELDLLMANSGDALPLLFDAGHLAFASGDVLRMIDNHHKRISHVHTKDIRRGVVDNLDRTKESLLDAVVKGAFTVPGDGSLDFGAIFGRLASHGYEGWFVVEAEQDPKVNPPLEMAKKGHAELLRVMSLAGYEVAK